MAAHLAGWPGCIFLLDKDSRALLRGGLRSIDLRAVQGRIIEAQGNKPKGVGAGFDIQRG